jgi:nucleotide-binding universal stress UspA family protein
MLKHILVAFDASENARKAAHFAHDLAEQTGARLTLLFVIEPPRVLPIGPLDSYLVTGPQHTEEEFRAVRRLLDEAAAELPRARVDKAVEVGVPADVVCAQADKLQADLIVVGARGHGTGGRWLLGSTSDRIVHQATRPVAVIK